MTKGAEIYAVTIEPHPNADRMEIAIIGGYKSLVKKGDFKTGDLVAYIPTGYIVPQPLLAEMGLEGALDGASRNRVKPKRLRGVLSEGLCYPARPEWTEGQDVTEELGLTKWKPDIPRQLAGFMYQLENHERLGFDIENLKREPDLFQEGEYVTITEKIHGTFMQVVGLPSRLRRDDTFHFHGQAIVTSKGLGGKSIGLKQTEENKDNLYIRMAEKYELREKAIQLAEAYDLPVYILGEVYGAGIQDLHYGEAEGAYANFDIKVGDEYMDYDGWSKTTDLLDIPTVPVLYVGPFQQSVVDDLTNGQTTLSEKDQHIREGVVVRSAVGRLDRFGNRIILKSVSEAYLTRKDGTEYN